VNVIYRFHDSDQNCYCRGIFQDNRQGKFGRRGGFSEGGVGLNLKGRQPGVHLCKPKWDLSSLKPLSKNFYVPHAHVLYMYDGTLMDTL